MSGAANPKPARIVCFGEILLRLAAPAPQLLLQENLLVPTFCGAEANVAVALAGFGHSCRMVSTVPANPLGQAARRSLAGFAVELALAELPDSRMGLYFLQPGAMSRPSAIVYDRAGSAFAAQDPAAYDWTTLLAGADWLYLSGISAALGDGVLSAMRAAIPAARAVGAKIAFDTNFRPTLWRGREALAARLLGEFTAAADLVFAGRRAAAMLTGGRFDQSDPDDAFHAAAQAMFAFAPQLHTMAATRRQVHSTDRQSLTALLADRAGLAVSETLELEQIVDRVGTGDAFAAGIVHGLASGMQRAEMVDFALRCAQWAHAVPGDFLRATLNDIAGLAHSGDVQR